MLGATAESVSVTWLVLSVAGVPFGSADDRSLSWNVVVVLVFGTPLAGVNVSFSSSAVMAAPVPVSV